MPSLFTQPPYAVTFAIVTLLWAVPDAIDASRRRPQGNTVIAHERGSQWFIRIGLLLALAAAILLAQRRPEGTLPYHRPILFVAGVVLVLAGFALRRAAVHALGRWLGLLLIALAIVVTFSYRVRLEERALLAALGDPYAAYMQRTKRFVPWLW